MQYNVQLALRSSSIHKFSPVATYGSFIALLAGLLAGLFSAPLSAAAVHVSAAGTGICEIPCLKWFVISAIVKVAGGLKE